MENEDLYCKIRELLDAPDEQQGWNPEKIWAMVEEKKSTQLTFSWIFYAVAAMSLFTFGFFVLNNNKTSLQVGQKGEVNADSEIGKNLPSTFTEHREHLAEVNIKHSEVFTGKKIKKKHRNNTFKLASNKYFRKADKLANPEAINMMLSQNDQDAPSLFQMYKQAQKERELRNLSVKLDDSEHYNRFWLAVNQHLLANKFSGQN